MGGGGGGGGGKQTLWYWGKGGYFQFGIGPIYFGPLRRAENPLQLLLMIDIVQFSLHMLYYIIDDTIILYVILLQKQNMLEPIILESIE